MTKSKIIILCCSCITAFALLLVVFLFCINIYGPSWGRSVFLVDSPPSLPNEIDTENELIEYAFSELRLNDTFSLCRLTGRFDNCGQMIGIWTIAFGKEINGTLLVYDLTVSFDSMECVLWSKAFGNRDKYRNPLSFSEWYVEYKTVAKTIIGLLNDEELSTLNHILIYNGYNCDYDIILRSEMEVTNRYTYDVNNDYLDKVM